jgi:hemerythrin superfamily protein
MSTHANSSRRQSAATKAAAKKPAAPDAIKLLSAEHKEVKALFKKYDALAESAADADERRALAEQICLKLTVHAAVEEELFYPAARDEADVEHATAKDLIAQIRKASPDEALYDAKVKVLGEYIEHHVKEEEGEIFPKIKKSELDVDSLGAEMVDRKQELMDELGVPA